MDKKNTRRASALLILGMLASPLAFAQATPTEAQDPPAAASQPTGPSSGKALSWADLDADGNGNLSKAEAQRHEGLASVFAQADADANGELTGDEYRAFIEKQQGGAPQE